MQTRSCSVRKVNATLANPRLANYLFAILNKLEWRIVEKLSAMWCLQNYTNCKIRKYLQRFYNVLKVVFSTVIGHFKDNYSFLFLAAIFWEKFTMEEKNKNNNVGKMLLIGCWNQTNGWFHFAHFPNPFILGMIIGRGYSHRLSGYKNYLTDWLSG